MSTPFLNRELSWIEFNQRVLNEALREDLPLLERVTHPVVVDPDPKLAAVARARGKSDFGGKLSRL